MTSKCPGESRTCNRAGRSRSRLKNSLGIAACSVVLLVIYVASIGPMYWLASEGVFGRGPITWLADVYGPLFRWVEDTSLKDELYWYISLGWDIPD